MAWSWIRIVAAVGGLSGVAAGFIVNVDRAARLDQDLGAVLANFFSLFTIISVTLGAIILLSAAVWSLRHPGTSPEPLAIALALAAVTGPILLLGIVYNVLLRGAPSGIAIPDPPVIAALDTWAVESLHVVVPLYFLVDLLFAPRRRGLPWWSLAVIVGYPVLWAAYTMVRGELVGNPDGSTTWWYPYPFLDRHGPGGYGSALLYIAGIMLAFLLIGWGIVAIGRARERRAQRRAEAAAVPA